MGRLTGSAAREAYSYRADAAVPAFFFRIAPRALRDKLYNVVARNRLDWFGRRETCFVPEPGDAERFIG